MSGISGSEARNIASEGSGTLPLTDPPHSSILTPTSADMDSQQQNEIMSGNPNRMEDRKMDKEANKSGANSATDVAGREEKGLAGAGVLGKVKDVADKVTPGDGSGSKLKGDGWMNDPQ